MPIAASTGKVEPIDKLDGLDEVEGLTLAQLDELKQQQSVQGVPASAQQEVDDQAKG